MKKHCLLILISVFLHSNALALTITFTNNEWSTSFENAGDVSAVSSVNTNTTSGCVNPGNPVLAEDQGSLTWISSFNGQTGIAVYRPPGDGEQAAANNGRHVAAGLEFSSQNQIRIGVLFYIGTEFSAAGQDTGSRGLIKWLGYKSGSDWSGLNGLQKCESAPYNDTYAPSIINSIDEYIHHDGTTNTCSTPIINFGTGAGGTDRAGQFVWVESWVDGIAGTHGVAWWTQDGVLSGDGWSNSGFGGRTVDALIIGGYWNGAHCDQTATGSDTSREQSKMYIAQIIVRNVNTQIGPPAGFVNSSGTGAASNDGTGTGRAVGGGSGGMRSY